MKEPVVEAPAGDQRIDRETAEDLESKVDADARQIDSCLRCLIAFGVCHVIGGALMLCVLLNLIDPKNWREALFLAMPAAHVGLGYFLLRQWIQFARKKRLLIASPRLWRISALYMVELAAWIVLAFAAEFGRDPADPRNPEAVKVIGLLIAFLLFPLFGFLLTTTLWRHASRP